MTLYLFYVILFILFLLVSPQVILGVTNPFFVKTLDHWPHLIKLADSGVGVASSDDARAPRSRSPGGDGGGDNRLGLRSKYKPFLNRDKIFAKFIVGTKVSCYDGMGIDIWTPTTVVRG